MKDLVAGWNGGKTGPTCPHEPTCGDVFHTPVGYGAETVAIAVDEHSQKTADEIARLIAAAPELYKTLEQVEPVINDMTASVEPGRKIRAALAKARGEQQ